jgi:hypothetical protein
MSHSQFCLSTAPTQRRQLRRGRMKRRPTSMGHLDAAPGAPRKAAGSRRAAGTARASASCRICRCRPSHPLGPWPGWCWKRRCSVQRSRSLVVRDPLGEPLSPVAAPFAPGVPFAPVTIVTAAWAAIGPPASKANCSAGSLRPTTETVLPLWAESTPREVASGRAPADQGLFSGVATIVGAVMSSASFAWRIVSTGPDVVR